MTALGAAFELYWAPSKGSPGPSWGHPQASKAHRKRMGGTTKIIYPLLSLKNLGFGEAPWGGPTTTWNRFAAVLRLHGISWKPHAAPRPPDVHCGIPLARVVASEGTQPKAPEAVSTCGPPPDACQLRRISDTFRGTAWSSTFGPSGKATCGAPPTTYPCRHTRQTLRGSSSRIHMRPPAHRMSMSAYPLHVSCPPGNLARDVPT